MIKRSERKRRVWRDLPDSKLLLAQLVGAKLRKLGFELICSDPRINNVAWPFGQGLGGWGVAPARLTTGTQWQVKGAPADQWFRTPRGAIKHWLLQHPRKYGAFYLTRGWHGESEKIQGRWLLMQHSGHGELRLAEWVVRPTRSALAKIIRHQRRLDPKPSHRRPETLGWRGWTWDTRQNYLRSPAQGTLWDCGPELRVTDWSEASAVRGRAGIHACRLPKGDWRMCRPPSDFMGSDIIGLVERFGKFVLGTEGWRAEWVIIRELLVCDDVTAVRVREAYPEIPVGVAPKGHWLRRGEY